MSGNGGTKVFLFSLGLSGAEVSDYSLKAFTIIHFFIDIYFMESSCKNRNE